jgi:hypothetical protein
VCKKGFFFPLMYFCKKHDHPGSEVKLRYSEEAPTVCPPSHAIFAAFGSAGMLDLGDFPPFGFGSEIFPYNYVQY